MMNDELAKNVTGWLYTLLESGQITIPSNQSRNVLESMEWLRKINSDELLVTEPEES